jgi:hypothetical protein
MAEGSISGLQNQRFLIRLAHQTSRMSREMGIKVIATETTATAGVAIIGKAKITVETTSTTAIKTIGTEEGAMAAAKTMNEVMTNPR